MATDAPNHEPVEPNSLTSPASPISNVVLLWIPLGAGQSVVRLSGKAFEALAALRHHRQRADLYHSALIVTVPEGRFVIEMTPVPDDHGAQRGVGGHGAVGMNWLGRFRVFRYENRCWPDGIIPDIEAALAVTLRVDTVTAERVLALVPFAPTPTWGRDELHTGEMWNSNSVIAWLLASGGADTTRLHPPGDGRAPGWAAGLVIAHRDHLITSIDSELSIPSGVGG